MHSATDTYQESVFQRMFKTPKTDQNAFNRVDSKLYSYCTAGALTLLKGILGSPPDANGPRRGFAGMVLTHDQARSNVRYYCDNDPQIINGGSRWTLRPDPPNPPQGYVPQRFRQRYDDSNPNAEHQEWEDLTNDIIMGDSNGCLDPGTMAETFDIKRPGSAGQQVDRVIITVRLHPIKSSVSQLQRVLIIIMQICDTTRNSRIHSFNDVPAKKDLSALINPVQGFTNIDAFLVMSSFTVLHEVSAFNSLTVLLCWHLLTVSQGMHMLPWHGKFVTYS